MKKAILFAALFVASTSFADVASDIKKAEEARKAKEFQKAVDILLPLAESGNIDAQHEIYYSLSALKKENESTKWLVKAAERGNAEAQITLGTLYYLGSEGIKKSYAEGSKWIKKAAEQGNINGLWFLGMAYRDGTGIPRSNVMAYMCFNIATAGGHVQTGPMRDALEMKMTPEEINKAQKLSLEWKPGTPLPESSN